MKTCFDSHQMGQTIEVYNPDGSIVCMQSRCQKCQLTLKVSIGSHGKPVAITTVNNNKVRPATPMQLITKGIGLVSTTTAGLGAFLLLSGSYPKVCGVVIGLLSLMFVAYLKRPAKFYKV